MHQRSAAVEPHANRAARILVVDDVAENRDVLIRRLKRLGFSAIEQAENGNEALAAIRSQPFDLVLLDIMMPELDGFGVLDALKREGRVDELPVVVISALGEIEPVVRCIELGAEDFLFKPFNPTLLRARVLASLEKKALRDRTREELARKRLELNEARALQLSLVPPPFRGTLAQHAVAVDALLEPAKEVGGDLVDHFVLDDALLVLVLGDVSDKGAGSALMMARTHAMFRGLAARPDAAALFREPERAIAIVNDALAQGNASCMFVTLLLATFDPAAGTLSYVRAGHIPPYLRRGDGAVERLDLLGGPPLGVLPGHAFRRGEVALAAGERLLVVTDGFTEAHDRDRALYGDERVAEFAAGIRPDEEAPLGRLVRDVRAFEAGGSVFDDIAAILLTIGAAPEAGAYAI